MKTAKALCVSFFCALICLASCSRAKPSSPSGEVRFVSNFPGAQAAAGELAKGMPGLRMVAPPGDTLVQAADLGLVELAGSMARQKESFASYSAYRGGLRSPSRLSPGLKDFPGTEGRWFLPAACYLWGLFSNKALLSQNGVSVPRDLPSFSAACAALKAKGVVPIAIGNSHGWPMLGWFATVDMLRNGPDAYVKLLSGGRSFSGKESLASLAQLNEWSKAGYFSPDYPDHLWTEGVKLLNEGKAAFLYVGGNAQERITDSGNIAFSILGPKAGKAPASVLGSVAGFVLPVSGSNREGALALADVFVLAGSPSLTGDGYRVPALSAAKPKPGKTAFPPDSIQALSSAALSAGTRVLPPLDFLLSEQSAYDLRDAFRSWPVQGFGTQAELVDFAARLDLALKPKS
jgi:hypothetical protein